MNSGGQRGKQRRDTFWKPVYLQMQQSCQWSSVLEMTLSLGAGGIAPLLGAAGLEEEVGRSAKGGGTCVQTQKPATHTVRLPGSSEKWKAPVRSQNRLWGFFSCRQNLGQSFQQVSEADKLKPHKQGSSYKDMGRKLCRKLPTSALPSQVTLSFWYLKVKFLILFK